MASDPRSPFDDTRVGVFGNPYHGLVEGGVLAHSSGDINLTDHTWRYPIAVPAVATPAAWGSVPDMSAENNPAVHALNQQNGWEWWERAIVHAWDTIYGRRIGYPPGWLTKGADGKIYWVSINGIGEKASFKPDLLVSVTEFGTVHQADVAYQFHSSHQTVTPQGVERDSDDWVIADALSDGSRGLIALIDESTSQPTLSGIWELSVAVDAVGQIAASATQLKTKTDCDGVAFDNTSNNPNWTYRVWGEWEEVVEELTSGTISFSDSCEPISIYYPSGYLRLSSSVPVEPRDSDSGGGIESNRVGSETINISRGFSGRIVWCAYSSGNAITYAYLSSSETSASSQTGAVTESGGGVFDLAGDQQGASLSASTTFSHRVDSSGGKTVTLEFGGASVEVYTDTAISHDYFDVQTDMHWIIGADRYDELGPPGYTLISNSNAVEWLEPGARFFQQDDGSTGDACNNGNPPEDPDHCPECVDPFFVAQVGVISSYKKVEYLSESSGDNQTANICGESVNYGAAFSVLGVGNKCVGVVITGSAQLATVLSADGDVLEGVGGGNNYLAHNPITGAIIKTETPSYWI